ncbi:Retrovirus-related Pol polyprotein from transposon.6 [Sesamum angolense]|uniref:Retrovirus-related Pol polyprotein from transposon.6 n=1 Tax=Sesamum angolense TaxID=2727404 RepID=A0AAE1T6R7_9LAMI|nr:Retrovirus-related Pol polyprotein from transposon.6 [Sesamum angolense]
MCPTLQEGPTKHADAIGGFFGQQQRRYDPFSNTYNPGWKDHPNLSYGAQSQNFQRPQYRPPIPPPSHPKQGTHLEDMMKSLISNTQQIQQNTQQQIQQLQQNTEHQFQQFQQSVQTSIQNLESQMSQLASSVSKLESQDENSTKRGQAQKRKTEKEVEIPQEQDDETKEDNPKVLITRPPFPERFTKSKKDEEAKEILETFRKVEVNIPLLDAIKQIPRYARFLKELCTSKGKLKGNERVSMGENVPVILQRKLPPKCKDPGTFTIPCKIGLIGIKRAMCDLGASINVMPLSIFESLHVGLLKEMGVVIQLTDRSVVYPEGVLEDVLVQVNELVFPADFYVLDMREDNSPSSTSILLGRPFLKMARTKIDVHSGTLSMEFDGEIIKFNIYDSMRYPSDIPTALLVDIVDPFVQALSSTISEDHVKFVLEKSLTPVLVQILQEDIIVNPNISESVFELESLSSLPPNLVFIELPQSRTKLLPSILQALAFELKELPKHLRYAYLGENNTLPVIISSKLNPLEEEKLIRVLREYKEAIGWTIADIKGLSPSTCMHRILLEEGTKPLREAQRQLNPPMMEVVKKEILKLLDAGMIFPISDSQWVNPTQVVPKKTGITVVENSVGNLVPTRVQNDWRVCIDYRKLNAATRKDHFPLPFINQMLERILSMIHQGFLENAQPLCTLLQKDAIFEFDGACAAAFDKLKESLTSAPVIRSPDWNLPFEIMCDASNHAIGAVLGQRIGKEPHVIYYASRMLDNTQSNYTTTEKELLAVVFALEKFRHYLLGTKVVVFSDHAALKYLLSKKEAKPRLIRWILLLQEFDLTIKDKKGAENLVADHLSRLVTNIDPSPLNDEFLDEHLHIVRGITPWYEDLVNFLVTGTLPRDLSRARKDKIRSESKYFVWDNPYLWKFCSDQLIQRCVPETEIPSILEFCHSYACGRDFGPKRTA